ncbi:hypothetical protein NMY22_g7782 [Coprinellus aureogranulatus]|nr:hypothetical protein NMY22_g7782 [Coprinellus aureogranulatus]
MTTNSTNELWETNSGSIERRITTSWHRAGGTGTGNERTLTTVGDASADATTATKKTAIALICILSCVEAVKERYKGLDGARSAIVDFSSFIPLAESSALEVFRERLQFRVSRLASVPAFGSPFCGLQE